MTNDERFAMLDKIVIMQAACGGDMGSGQIIAHAPFPTYTIVGADGKREYWGTHLCRAATAAEEVAYWRERAMAAEYREREAARNGE